MIYLLHFERRINPTRPAQHYLGWTNNLKQRIANHRQGTGARLCEVAKQRQIRFTVARTWEGDRQLERNLKLQKNGRRLCPICNPRQRRLNGHSRF